MDTIFKLDLFLNSHCLNLDLLALPYTLMLSLNLAASNSFAEETSSLFIGGNIVNSDIGVPHKIMLKTRDLLPPVVVPRYDPNCQLWIASMSWIYFFDYNSLPQTKSSNFTLDTAAHFSNLSSSMDKTENPTECNTSIRSRDRDTLWVNGLIAKRTGDQ